MMTYYSKALQNYAVFSGRAARREFWYFYLVNLIIAFGLWIVGGLTGTSIVSSVYPAVLIPCIAVGVRRMHDVEKSGWYFFIPVYNLVLASKTGVHGENQYGSDPTTIPSSEI